MTKFWEGIAGQLGKDWALRVATPAFIFCAVGVVAWSSHIWGLDAPTRLGAWIGARSVGELSGLALTGLIGVTILAWFGDQITLPLLRFLEGYWPAFLGGLRMLAVKRQLASFAEKERKWHALAAKLDANTITLQGRMAYAALDESLRRYPPGGNLMPTRLGNSLRAAETWPEVNTKS